MLRSQLAKSHSARRKNGFSAFSEFFLHVGTHVSCSRRLSDHGIERAPASEQGDLARIFFRCRQQALDIKPVRIGQRERRRHKYNFGEIFCQHGVYRRLHGAADIGFIEVRVHVDVRTHRGDRSL